MKRGQATILIVGFAVVLAMVVALVVDTSAAYLQRQGLDTLADGAALRGADLGATGEDVYQGGVPRTRSRSPPPRRGPRSAPTSATPAPTPATRASPTPSASPATGSRCSLHAPARPAAVHPGLARAQASIGAEGSAVVGVDE